ncbi:MAG TPA: biotin/lipoyl-containing protein [Armatimonadota bacterium]|nr:biotin/lipoyl-containing protein [Armatimonadota bacterium]
MARLIDVLSDDLTEEDQTSCEAVMLFWYPEVGDAVEADADLAEIETAKAVVVVKAPVGGVIKEILVREGDAVEPQQKLAVIECPD